MMRIGGAVFIKKDRFGLERGCLAGRNSLPISGAS
jgi:hypothetical protein